MADNDPQTTQRDVAPDIAGDLVAAGFSEPALIGHGGFGAVYRCVQATLDRTVAVKVLTDHLDDENLERFVREQRAMGRLSGHPNIVNILEVGSTPGGHPFIVMQYHPHDSLDARIRKQGPLEWADVLRLGIKVSGALETAHRCGTLHRDVKPGNILLTEYGEPQLTDFGIARIAGGFETGADLVTGSPAFTAPELLTGAMPSVASDIYGLGATLFCALTGHAAFERRSGEQVVAHFLRVASEPVPDLSDAGIPDVLSRAIEHAMAREPEDRPRTAAEYGEELRDIERSLGIAVNEMALPIEATGDPLTPTTRRPHGTITAPPTPSTKFRPPIRPRTQVPRERLLEILRAGERRRLILIHAPAGYGKTTVAAQWAEELWRDGVLVAWLTVDDDDNNATWFLTHLVESIRRTDPDVVADLGDVLEEHRDNAEQYVLAALVNEIHERAKRLVVVVDDWHRVTDPGAISAMDFLLEHGCHHLQMVVTSRNRAGLPISRMRVRDELVEIDIARLCFDAAEARSFLLDVAGLDLDNSEVTDLWTSTDGWVAALQLACLSLRGSDTPADLISHISGRHHAIGDFLAENVLGALEPEMLNFLLTISVPERICAGLATALSGESRGQALLEDAEARDLFLSRVDQDGDWFRLHPLFAEFLRQRLDRDRPDSSPELNRIASEWFSRHDMLPEAVAHALSADDPGRAAELVEAGGGQLIEHSQMTVLLGLVDRLPTAAVISSPRLQLLVAWADILLHRTDLAHAALERVDTALSVGSLPAEEISDIRAEADVAEACTRATADRLTRLDELVDECLSRPDTMPPFVVSAAANVATISATFRFDFDNAHRWQEWAIPYHQLNTGPYAVMYGHALGGLAAVEELDLDRAEEEYRAALRVSSPSGAVRSQSARLACGLLAELRYARGDIAESTRLHAESFELGAEEGLIDMIKARYVTAARLAVIRDDRVAAARYLDEAADIADRLAAPRLRSLIEYEQVVLGLPTRWVLGPRAEFAQRSRPTVGIAEIVAQLDEEVAIRLLLDDGDAADLDIACRWAAEWVTRLGHGRRRLASDRAERLLALALTVAGRHSEAEQHMSVLLEHCASVGMVRFPMDGGQQLVPLIGEIRADLAAGGGTSAYGLSVEFLDRVLEGH
ncbi:serine/threonine-protein kinase [Gordonia insulae]|uniref:Serine/threonine-protein kinase PknK n=1 Tax=Gordonia insulae TaxID=2420509 RepID=A0A3G8JSM4_9ACTN|nr:serine/threonine-protein kinase [Gordonia insulae]AZG47725.1 Serine/threonine-protein kinase PknK [Gordonia insulae]